jgi:hypothetical protein
MNRHLVTILVLVAAVALYAIGLIFPATVLVLLGAIAEMTFWVRLFRGGRKKSRGDDS